MSSLRILFLALIAIIGPLRTVESAIPQVIDVNELLEVLKEQQFAGTPTHIDKSDLEPDNDSDVVDDLADKGDNENFDNPNARLTKQRIIDLIESAVNQKTNKPQNYNHREENPSDLNTYVSRDADDNQEIIQRNLLQKLVIEQLLSRGFGGGEIKEKSKDYSLNRIKPNRPNRVASSSKGDRLKRRNKNKKPIRLEDYSNIVVVLNPQAVRKSKNKDSLNKLITEILSITSKRSKNDRQDEKKPRRFKRVDMNENRVQRRYRQSRERHARRDSADEDYNQKRSNRNGGSPAGRTAIPYIKHRGDIYERED